MPASRPTVVLLCGPSGSGKTTLARRLEAEGYVRVGIDQLVHERFGRYGYDVPVESYQELNDAVEEEFRERVQGLVRAGHDVVVDRALWQRRERDLYKRLVEEAGGQWRLLHLAVPPDELRGRITARRRREDSDAFPVTDELLEQFLTTFETPHDEGEEVLHPPQI